MTTTISKYTALTFDTSILAGTVAPSSMAMYERDFKAYLVYTQTPEMAMQSSTLARWRTHLVTSTTMSPNTINRMLHAVKSIMLSAEEQGYVPDGTAQRFTRVRQVKVGKLKTRTKTHARVRIEIEDMRRLCDSPDLDTPKGLRDRAILHTLATSGVRVHELVKIRIGDIARNAQGYYLMVLGKNDDKPRQAPLSPEAHMYIEEWLAQRPVDSDFVFTSYAGRGGRLTNKQMTEMSLWRQVKAYASQCGLENIKPHDFRRFVGTQLAKKNPRAAQKALGHKMISTTMDNYVLDDLEIGLTDKLY